MINPRQILRMVQFEEYPKLVDRVLSNGRCPSSSIKRHLGVGEIAATAGMGLALQRLAELTYAPSPLGQRLAERLAALQRRDGTFGTNAEPSMNSLLASTATALAGLMTWAQQCRAHRGQADAQTSIAIDRGLQALVDLYGDGSEFNEHAIGWAIVLWQLGPFESFRKTLDLAKLLQQLGDAIDEPLLDDLYGYARAAAA